MSNIENNTYLLVLKNRGTDKWYPQLSYELPLTVKYKQLNLSSIGLDIKYFDTKKECCEYYKNVLLGRKDLSYVIYPEKFNSTDASSLRTYTGRLQQKSMANVDITIMTGNESFAPTWSMVHGIKDSSLSESNFTEKYIKMMYKSLESHTGDWEYLINLHLVVLACYCKSGVFCHRHLLEKFLGLLGARCLGEITFK